MKVRMHEEDFPPPALVPLEDRLGGPVRRIPEQSTASLPSVDYRCQPSRFLLFLDGHPDTLMIRQSHRLKGRRTPSS
jgi:hypothetical protein